jgi:hypothetical protein
MPLTGHIVMAVYDQSALLTRESMAYPKAVATPITMSREVAWFKSETQLSLEGMAVNQAPHAWERWMQRLVVRSGRNPNSAGNSDRNVVPVRNYI